MSKEARRPSLKSLYEQMERCQKAYCADGPDYIRVRMLGLVEQMRESLDGIEQILYEAGEVQSQSKAPDTGELEAVR